MEKKLTYSQNDDDNDGKEPATQRTHAPALPGAGLPAAASVTDEEQRLSPSRQMMMMLHACPRHYLRSEATSGLQGRGSLRRPLWSIKEGVESRPLSIRPLPALAFAAR
jgi:hypothetical protein